MKLLTSDNLSSSKRLFISLVIVAVCGISTSLSAQQMTITPGTNLVLNGNVSLVLNNAALQNNGAFAAGTSTVNFSGQKDTLVSYVSGTSSTTFNNLSVSKSAYGVALKSVVAVKNILSVSAGNLYTDSNLTLISDRNFTAMVDVVPSTSNIIGKTMVERYIPARRAWRLLTAPVSNSNTIYNSWQNNGVYTVGRGMLVTGPNPTAANGNGLDYSAQNTSSMKGFNYSTQGFTQVLNTKVAISKGNSNNANNTGYLVFVRGDRNPANTTLGIDNSTTLTSIGTLQTGTQTFTASSVSGGYTLIGNPYASPVNFDNVARTNLIKRFYVWDFSLNVVGGYVMLDDLDNNGIYSKSVSGSAQTKDIQSSQAFFVQTNVAGAASLTFNETSKSVNNNNLVYSRPVTGAATGKITTTLNLLNADSTTTLADGTFAEFNAIFSAGVDLDDAAKFGNANENIGIVRDNNLLAAERRPVPGLKDTVFFRLTNTTQRSYQLLVNIEDLQLPNIKAYLQDSYLGTSTLLSFSGSTAVNFSINTEKASAAINRFMIIFKHQTLALPATISTVNAIQHNSTNTVEWQVENESNVEKYDVERSTDGKAFSKVNTTNVASDSSSNNTYSWLDVNALQGNTFYRIRSYNKSGEIKYSSIVKVAAGANSNGFSIYPNPVTGNVINLIMKDQPAGKYQVKLTNITGQVIFVKSFQGNGGNSTESLNTGTKLLAGIYQLEITGQDNSHNTQKVIVE